MRYLNFNDYFKEIEFTHGVLDRPVRVTAGSIGFYMYSEKSSCTHIFTPAGVLPVKESVEEVSNKLTALKEASNGK